MMRFSVIIPLYNKAPYIRKTLESAATQTFGDYEIIVVDDGSTDGSGDVAESVLNASGRKCQLIRQENAGVSAARNAAIAAAQGEYICLLDADDWWDPTFLEKMDKLIKDYPKAGLYCTNYNYVHNGKSRVMLNIPTGYFNYCREYARLMRMIATSSCCVQKAILMEMGGFKTNLKLGEDFDMWIRIALRYGTAICSEPLVWFNNDLPSSHRATHHLHAPESHMLWHLDYLAEEERANPECKQLLDNLRVYSLLPYWLSSKYHDVAGQELNKVDWSKQPKQAASLYKRPLWVVRSQMKFRKLGSAIKQAIIKHI